MNEQQKKYLNCLNEIYELTKDDFARLSIFKIVGKHKASLRLTKLIKDNFVYNDGKYRHVSYKWKTIKPNIKMVDKCILELSKLNREETLKYKSVLPISNSKHRLDFINYFKSNFSNDFKFKPIEALCKEYKIHHSFKSYLINNDYILKRRAIGIGGTSQEWKWNTNKDFEELKRLILEADPNYKGNAQPLQPKVKKVTPKKVTPKPSNVNQTKVYEDIIRMINNDLDAKDKKIEELEKKLSLRRKRTKQKTISIFWGLIKITK